MTHLIFAIVLSGCAVYLIVAIVRTRVPRNHRTRCQCRKCRRVNKHQGDPPRLDGSHEACALSEDQRLWFDYFTRRYAGLGTDVTR